MKVIMCKCWTLKGGEGWLTAGQELCTFPLPVSLTDVLRHLSLRGEDVLYCLLFSLLNLVYMAPAARKHLSNRDGTGVTRVCYKVC